MAPRKKKPQRAHYFYRVTIIPSTFNRQKYLPPARQTWSNISVQTAASVLIQSCCRRSQKVKMGADKNFLNQYLVSRCGSNTFAQKRLAENISRLHKESWGVPGCWIDALGAHHYFTYTARRCRRRAFLFIWAIGLYGVRLLRQKRTSPLIGGCRDERRVEIICHHKSCQILRRRGARSV